MVGFGLIIFKCIAQNNIVVSVLEPGKSGKKEQCSQLSLYTLKHFGVRESVSMILVSLTAQ